MPHYLISYYHYLFLIRFKFFKRGDLDDGNGVVYNVMTPLVVDEGTPCKNTGAQGVDDVKGVS